MRPRSLLLALPLLAAPAAQAVDLAVWNFNDAANSTSSPANQAALFSVDQTDASVLSASMSTSFAASGVNAFAGSTVGAPSGTAAGQALALVNQANNGGTLTFSLAKSPNFTLSGLVVTLATQRTGTGFTGNQFAYSVDGGASFVDLGAPYAPADAFAAQRFDLSGISALGTAATATFRITFNGASSAAGNNRIDNLVVSGTAAPVPEPASLAALAVGAAGLARRRRRG